MLEQPSTSEQSPASRDLGRYFPERIAFYFAAVFLIYGVHITYFPVWLASRGLKPEEIGLLTALPILLRALLTPAIAAHADATGRHRLIVVGLSIASAVLAVAVWASPNFFWLAVTVVAFSIAIVTVLPLTDTMAVAGVRAGGHDYGRMRLWGSLTFLLATLIAGALFDAYGAPSIMWAMMAASVATGLAALTLPKLKPDIVARPPADGSESGLVRRLLTTPVFLLFLLTVGAIQSSHVAFYTFGALHLQGQGVSGTAFGTLWAIAILAEMALFAWSAPFVERFGPMKLLIAGGVAAVVRWGVMGLDPPYAVVVVLQVLHALTYGASHLGAIHFIARAVPTTGAGTAQALYSAIGNGLVTAAATYVAGLLYPQLAGGTFYAMGAIALAGTATGIYIHKTWDRRPLI
jgi:PPP family 3-phenylpropionic acid transporter